MDGIFKRDVDITALTLSFTIFRLKESHLLRSASVCLTEEITVLLCTGSRSLLFHVCMYSGYSSFIFATSEDAALIN